MNSQTWADDPGWFWTYRFLDVQVHIEDEEEETDESS